MLGKQQILLETSREDRTALPARVPERALLNLLFNYQLFMCGVSLQRLIGSHRRLAAIGKLPKAVS